MSLLATTATVIVSAVALAVGISPFVSLTLDDTIHARDYVPAHVVAAPAPGNLYEFVDGRPIKSPVCALTDTKAVVIRPNQVQFTNRAGQLFPPVTKLLDGLNFIEAAEVAGVSGLDRSLYQMTWKFNELSVIRADQPAIKPGCEEIVARILGGNGKICILDTVLAARADGEAAGESFAVSFRPKCLTAACSADKTCQPAALPALGVAHWTTRMKLSLGLVATSRGA